MPLELQPAGGGMHVSVRWLTLARTLRSCAVASKPA
jgi:hypothetical protein